MRRLHCSFFPGARSSTVTEWTGLWETLSGRLTAFPPAGTTDKLALAAFSPARFVSGTTRASANVRDVHLAVLDFDDGATIEGERRRWAGHAHVVYTTFSHTAERPKFRVVLPLVRPVSVSLWPRAYQHLEVRTGGAIDPQCKDPGRLFFLPVLRASHAETFAVAHDGPWLDIDADRLPLTPVELARARRRRRPRPTSFVNQAALDREVRRALATDPAARARAANALGGQVFDRPTGRIAKRILCPSCGRPSVWFLLEPHRKRSASCEHANSCGWTAPLHELLTTSGVPSHG